LYENSDAWWNAGDPPNHTLSSRALAERHGGDDANWRTRLRARNRPRPIKGIAVFDLHYPHHTERLWKNILRFTADFAPDVFLFGGDNMNMDAFDHWKREKNKRRQMEGVRVKKDYKGFQSAVLNPLEKRLPNACRKVFMLGNHEDWAKQYIDEHPESEGYYEIEHNLDLDDWEVYEYGQSAQVGKLHFIHGLYVVQHNAAKTVSVYHRNVVYGHGHTYQAHTEITPLDSDAHTGTQIPCACEMNPDYARNKPNAWLNGFAVFHIHPDGNFNLFPVIATDGKFTAPNGVYYD
jgi:hypothetical protein